MSDPSSAVPTGDSVRSPATAKPTPAGARAIGTDTPGSHAEIDAALRRIAAARGPLRRARAAVCARLIEAHSWERLGFARLADYARERAGLSARQVQDLARVNAALADLPHVEAALVAGDLSWTKVRLLCRVATRADEARWIALARRLRASELSREVRAVDVGAAGAGAPGVSVDDSDEDGSRVEPRETVWIRCSHVARVKLEVALQEPV